ncbi:MAG: cytochrome P450 [Acidimicrobiia bacterium]|nr:cytochrome P450 [Acidimicrobiia bacterium]
MRHAAEATVTPMPPTVDGALPWVDAGLGLLRDPTAFFATARQRHGDTFVIDAFGFRLFCVFSAAGVRRLYELPEREASFGLATYRLIGFKLPPELLVGRRNAPHQLFGAQKVEGYLRTLDDAVSLELADLGPSGRFDVFDECRRLGHRLGFATWAGVEAASPRYLDRLIPLFDRIDSSQAFVRPAQGFVTWATRRARERRAMHGIEAVVAEIWHERQRDGRQEHDFLEQLVASYADLPPDEQLVGAARDVIMLHVGAQSNLYAALAWTLVRVLEHPELAAAIRAGDDDLLERCASDAIRLAQRSITLREVLTPIEIDDGERTYSLGPGTFVTTMLSVTNPTAAPGLDEFDPDHYVGRRLAPDVAVETKELVSTFGHGSHTCPAGRFSISAIRIAVRRLLETYELTPEFDRPEPRRRQMGGVARAERPIRVRYASR